MTGKESRVTGAKSEMTDRAEFDTHAYMQSLGEDLVHAYGRAGHATTSGGLVGRARLGQRPTNDRFFMPFGEGEKKST